MKKRIGKGDYGYLKYAKNRQLIWTVILFAVSLSLLIGGYLLVHTKANLLTMVAVLGMLPASKSLVQYIMFMKAKGCSAADYEQIKAHEGELLVLYDLYFTSEKKNYPVSAMALKGKTICFYVSGAESLVSACEKHFEGVFRQNQFEGYTVKGFTRLDRFLERLDSLDKVSMEHAKIDSFVLETILNICL